MKATTAPGSLPLLATTLVAIISSNIYANGVSGKTKSAIEWVNLLIGTTGKTPNTSGGMIPSVAPPFGMTRWVAQTQVSYVSATPYNASWALPGGEADNTKIHGFMGTRQPAIWMGESGSIAVIPGVVVSEEGAEPSNIKTKFEERGLSVVMNAGKREEYISPDLYTVLVEDNAESKVLCEMSATSRVGHLQFTFEDSSVPNRHPYVLIEAARPSIITSTPTNVTYPLGYVVILPTGPTGKDAFEICGYSTERQDAIVTPVSGQKAAEGFKGYFCARFSVRSVQQEDEGEKLVYGVIQNGTVYPGKTEMEGPVLSAFLFLPDGKVDVRVGTSFISIEQARANIDDEIKDDTSLQATSNRVRSEWTALLDRVQIKVGGEDDEEATVVKEVFWTAVVHALQYPSEQHESSRYWSGYDGKVHQIEEGGGSYTGYSIWDTYRAIWSLQILFVPELIPGMIQSMLADFKESGWLPMWKNIVETNIMIGTHADSLIAEAALKNISGFDRELAWEAVWKDATVPPVKDWDLLYDDREEHVDYEVRAGLSSVYNVEGKGWVADDIHSESASRTLAYAYDDYAAYVLAKSLGKPENVTQFFLNRAMKTPFSIYNDATGFMEARNKDGSWAGEDRGWTEGDKWAYTFEVVHNIPELIKRRGGRVAFVKSLEEHFEGGHNDHTNEPSHHIPYLYSLSGAAFKAQERIREIAKENYNNKPDGLTGNEDCGQMSAWYVFSALGFYPVNPVSGEYVVGSPFFEEVVLQLPDPVNLNTDLNRKPRRIKVSALGARTRPYIKSLTINGISISGPIIRHEDLLGMGPESNNAIEVDVVFEMSDTIQQWGNDGEVLQALGVAASSDSGSTNGNTEDEVQRGNGRYGDEL